MSLSTLLIRWQNDPAVKDNIAAWRTLEARLPQTASLPASLHPALTQALNARGIHALYSHQAAAWEHAQQGEHVAVVTGTASGKTLAYNLPVLDALLQDETARALYLFPTKALARDQLSVIRDLLPTSSGKAGVYDGDTPQGQRQSIRKENQVVISNPDMLHTGILPHHTQWAEFFRNLRFVVIDEMHTYRGVFGSHVANVLRRLRRVARFYGAYPQFILTSATIANPLELAERLVESPVTLIEQDGAARGAKHFVIYNPPVVNEQLGLRQSALLESVRLADDLLSAGLQTILFGRTRRSVELMLKYLREGNPRFTEETVRGYRSGYLPLQRREIEQGLRQGKVRAVVATTALELGIDIGRMEAAVLAGYPGTIASTWQQAGRAGRSELPAIAVLVATPAPLDQFLAHHPDYFFGRAPEQALVNPDNLLILLGHLRCAAFELPFQPGEAFGRLPVDQTQEFLDYLVASGELHTSNQRYFWMSEQYPAQSISLRSASPANVLLQTVDPASGELRTVGEVDQASAAWMVHPGAVYLHEAQSYLVEALDLEQHSARLAAVELDYYTQTLAESTVALLHQASQEPVAGGQRCFGEIQVTTQISGFRKVRWLTGEHLGTEPLDLPPSELVTMGYWLALSQATVDKLSEAGLWTNAPNDYGPEWPKIRQRVRARDGFRCQVCGLPEVGGRSHDVHHKIPFRSFASRPGALDQANQLSNLITLCTNCHKRAETAVRLRSGLAGAAYALANLAPLFVACDAHDLGMHTDPQSPLAEGLPVIVLYDLAPGGIGLSERLYELHSELVRRARQLVSECECSDGCPSCTGPGGENGGGGKKEALALLEAVDGG